MAAAQHPLLQPDILYLVLQHLPQVDLLLAQSVCRAWHASIQRSAVLQQALFFQSTADSSAAPAAAGPVELNPLLVAHFHGIYFSHELPAVDYGLGPFRAVRWKMLADWDAAAVLAEPGAPPSSRRTLAYARADASWRRMLPCQPGPRELQVVRERCGRGGTWGTARRVRFPLREGSGGGSSSSSSSGPGLCANTLTFGLIYDLVHDYIFPTSAERVGVSAHMEIAGAPAVAKTDAGGADGEKRRCSTMMLTSDRQAAIAASVRARKARYQRALPWDNYAAPGCVVLRLTRIVQCKRYRHSDDYSSHYLASSGSVLRREGAVPWEPEHEFQLDRGW